MSRYYTGGYVNEVLGKSRKRRKVKPFGWLFKVGRHMLAFGIALLIFLWGWILLVLALRIVGWM